MSVDKPANKPANEPAKPSTNTSHNESPNELLHLQIDHRAGAVPLRLHFTLTQPWTVLFGPSGSGKTTILRAIAGFIKPDTGRIQLRQTTLYDSSRNLFLPAHQRPIRTAGQTARLFPHITVQQNILFGHGWPTKPTDAIGLAQEVMTSFHLHNLADRSPHELSGGEQQRASVARALVSAITFDSLKRPLLLLDEPLSGLDIAMRDQMVVALNKWITQFQIPVLSVTHNLGEAFQLGAEVIKIANGQIVQQGPVEVVLEEERERLLEQINERRRSKP